MDNLTKRQGIILAALSAGENASFTPVQLQKLFFLIDRNLADDLGGPQFTFEPYDYGPFDRSLYDEMGVLAMKGLASVEATFGAARRRYSLTEKGRTLGNDIAKSLSARVTDYFSKLSEWVRAQSFAQLVGSIYNQYPEMKANSIFRS